MTRRVLVTRPEPGASATAVRLSQMGLAPLVLPLTRIEALPARLPEGRAGFEGMVLTSANAVRMASIDMLAGVSDLPCFAVGPATADVAKEAGLSVTLASGGDATSLASDIMRRVAPGSRLVYLCGRVRTPTLEAALDEAGIEVTPVETYDAVALDHSSQALRERLGRRPLDYALVHSQRGGDLLSKIMSRPELGDLFAGTIVFSISAKAARSLADHCIEVAAEPSEPALLALVKAKV